eukprot:1139130-Amphidinium_carterae.1
MGGSPPALDRGIRREAWTTAGPCKPHVDVGWLPVGSTRLWPNVVSRPGVSAAHAPQDSTPLAAPGGRRRGLWF